MNTTGAGVCLATGRVIWLYRFNEAEGGRHINWKEAYTATHTTWAAARAAEPGTLFLIAVDNTAAKAVLNAGCIPWDPELDQQLRELREFLRLQGSDFEAVYVPGIQQPADEPSRKEQVEMDKVIQCRKLLMDVTHPWWRTVNL